MTRAGRTPGVVTGDGGRAWIRAALFLVPLLFVPGLVEAFEMPKVLALRVCGAALAGLALGSWRDLRRVRWAPMDLAVLAWILAEILATAFSVSPRLSLAGDASQREGLITSLALAALYLGVRRSVSGAEDAKTLLRPFLLSVAIACAYALLQVARLDPFPFTAMARYGPNGEYIRPFATLTHADLLGPIAATAGIVALALAMSGGGRTGTWLGAVALAFIVTALTLARGAWLGAGAGVIALLAGSALARGLRMPSGRAVGWTLGGVAGLAVVFHLAGVDRPVLDRLRELVSVTGSSRSRIEIWRGALRMAAARPWTGQGPDLFGLRFPAFQTPEYWRFEWGGLPYHAHSIYLQTLATRGALGVVAGVVWSVAWLWAAFRALRGSADARSLAAPLVGGMVCLAVAGAFGALGITGAMVMVTLSAMIASLAWGPARPGEIAAPEASRTTASSRPARARASRPPAMPWPAVVLVTLAAISAILDLAAEQQASVAYSRFRSTGEGGEPLRLAAEEAGRAATLSPWHDNYLLLRAGSLLALERTADRSAGAIAEAEQAARRAVTREPLRSGNWEVLAAVLGDRVARGDAAVAAEAESAWVRAHALAPVDGVMALHHAGAEMNARNPVRAAAILARAAAIYPEEGPVLFSLGAAQAAAGDSSAARDAYRRAVSAEWHGNEAGRRAAESAARGSGSR